ncbi:MAG: hypothetical protein AB8G23_13990 [Myxococcota bacterium]
MVNPEDQDSDERVLSPEQSDGDGDEFPNVDQIIGTFMKESSLWPVLIVLLGTAGAFGGAMLVLVGVDRNPFAAAALVLLLGMTTDLLIRSRKNQGLRNLARLVGLVWFVAACFAGLAVWTGLAF